VSQEVEELLRTSECSARVSLSDFRLLVDDLDTYIKEEPSHVAANEASYTSRTDGMIACSQ